MQTGCGRGLLRRVARGCATLALAGCATSEAAGTGTEPAADAGGTSAFDATIPDGTADGGGAPIDTGAPPADARDAEARADSGDDAGLPGCPTTTPVRSAAMGSHFDPAVFDPAYYLCKNPDLAAAGLKSVAALRLHWLNHGVTEGRRAHPAFSVTEYLAKYPDLQAAFGSNRRAAVLHYVHHGLREGRAGTLAGTPNAAAAVGQDLRPAGNVDYDPSSRARNDIIDLGSSARMAGGIDHLGWNGVEFINAYDHGRELQVAWQLDGYGECHNPTECGSAPDGTGSATSSALQAYWTSGPLLGSEVKPAFWFAPGTQYCGPVRNTTVTSEQVLNKVVRVGFGGIRHVVEFLIQLTIADDLKSLTIEAPTGYLTGAFTSFFTIDVATGTLAPLSEGPGEQPLPVILSTPDGSAAMGAWSPDIPQAGAGYGRWAFPNPANPASATHKWNIVFRRGALPAGVHDFRGYAVVGTRENVRVAMTQLRALFP